MNEYLRPTEVMDWDHPDVRDLARALAGGAADPTAIAKRSFEWVRDEIRHSGDCKVNQPTYAASEVLRHEAGWCFAKSHLLAALLRANGIPAGLCYQRLVMDSETNRFMLHGLNAILLPEFGWYRIDPRGNKPGVDARFDPPNETLAWPMTLAGEGHLREVRADPLPSVIDVLTGYDTWEGVQDHLPDISSEVELVARGECPAAFVEDCSSDGAR
jgi:transglutaminase-like putative cysteine protease